ncbi:MAG: capsular biosynthesis protein, partial [Cetobacterium sp.]
IIKIKIKNKIYKLKKSDETLIVNKIKLELETYFNIDSIETLNESNIKKTIVSFIEIKRYYLNFLRLKSCQKVYLICSYGREELISAAQELGIEVIEIQHGVMNKYHLGYHFPNNKTVPYFPDKLIMFGEYWYQNTVIPLTKEQIEFQGYPYLEKQLSKYKGKITEKENTVLFISQGTIGKKFTEKAIEFAKDNPNKKVLVRLHPGEFSRWQTEYDILYKNRNLLNLEISDNNDKNLYEYIFESEYIICVYSTVIYEALHLGKKVGIIDLSGFENIEDLIEKKEVYKYLKSEKINLKKIDSLKKNHFKYF